MLLVVLGAGASYDSVPASPPAEATIESRPPLSDGLFENRPVFREAMGSFGECQPIVPLLQRRHGRSLEEVLQSLVLEAPQYPERYRQLAAVRYYIQYILRRTEDDWLRFASYVTNYRSLLDQISRWRHPGEPVCLVTFNYDRLIEAALRGAGIAIDTLPDYVANESFKLFKLHGSIDWVRDVELDMPDVVATNHQWTAAQAIMRNAATIRIGTSFSISTEYPTGILDSKLVIPAIAIPVQDKGEFECPRDHLDLLQNLIPRTERLLLIGWRATELHFLRLLRERLRRPILGYIVNGTTAAATETADRMTTAGIKGEFKQSNGGFTETITRRELDAFLNT